MSVVKVYLTEKGVGVKGLVNYQFIADRLAARSAAVQAKGLLMRGVPLGQTDKEYNSSELSEPTDQQLLNSGTVSMFGRKVFSDIVFSGETRDLVIINGIMEVSLAENIVLTAVPRRRGTVKEHTGASDYQITLTGSIIGTEKDKYPLDDVYDFIRIIETGREISVFSEYLALWDIFTVVLERHRFTQRAGFQNIQDFELRFLSDREVQLEIDEEKSVADFTSGF